MAHFLLDTAGWPELTLKRLSLRSRQMLRIALTRNSKAPKALSPDLSTGIVVFQNQLVQLVPSLQANVLDPNETSRSLWYSFYELERTKTSTVLFTRRPRISPENSSCDLQYLEGNRFLFRTPSIAYPSEPRKWELVRIINPSRSEYSLRRH
ncbi:uncharacterized protein EV420DRAFT_1564185 [Desarmillaria tabescens]|uniref:Uncharacterized protein n=1 Tax=Armillaria tabescens TaxID=1929756 RepID=A0AA39JWB2_ARMTA|nr:uncharacterized protein EV420DRAFT_1564185 [Desarmillaria tabescens]KAK0449802.1 hypothetical protein EV420DRAFT_1564185 [Desarmillaria tabescens]